MRLEILVANGISLDLTEETELSFNYALADIREPESRSTDFSKTITIPGTKKNNDLFSNLFEIGASAVNFNPKIKTDVQVWYDGNQIFEGYLQLLNIKRREHEVSYEVALFGQIGNFFKDIEGLKLEDLDLSEYDHTYSVTNIRNSWATSIKRNGVDIPFLLGRGYVYPLEQRGIRTDSRWSVDMMYPAVYAKEYLDKIFNEA
jgi:hypothetical protein